MAAPGLRVSEALRLRNGDVDLQSRTADDAADEVRQVPPGAGASEHA